MRSNQKPAVLSVYNADRSNPLDSPNPGRIGEAPDWFDDLAREAWDKIGIMLSSVGTANQADAETVAIYCQCYSVWRKASRSIATEGMTIQTGVKIAINPMVHAAQKAERTMLQVLVQLGLTPVSRAVL